MRGDRMFKIILLIVSFIVLLCLGIVIGVRWEHRAAAADRLVIYYQGAERMADVLKTVDQCAPFVPEVTFENFKMESE